LFVKPSAKIVEDSVARNGKRLMTFEIVLPKVLLAEFNTHRVFSRNFSSSRAIPTAKFNAIESWEPKFWGSNVPGMQSGDEVSAEAQVEMKRIWDETIAHNKAAAARLSELGLHKQWANRMNDWHTMAKGVVTSTEWSNFFELRNHKDAQPEIRDLAVSIIEAMESSYPVLRQTYSSGAFDQSMWHLPYVLPEEREQARTQDDINALLKYSTARCARASYLTHGGDKPRPEEDVKLFERLVGSVPRHSSPTEHQATPLLFECDRSGNFFGWKQHRGFIG